MSARVRKGGQGGRVRMSFGSKILQSSVLPCEQGTLDCARGGVGPSANQRKGAARI